jgi:hypothetical protein
MAGLDHPPKPEKSPKDGLLSSERMMMLVRKERQCNIKKKMMHKQEMFRQVRTVSIPQRESSTTTEGSHDGIPLRSRGVDSTVDASSGTTLRHGVEEVSVGALVRPILRTLNVEPKHTNVSTSTTQSRNGGLDLTIAISTGGTREDVSINMRHASSPGTCEGKRGKDERRRVRVR